MSDATFHHLMRWNVGNFEALITVRATSPPVYPSARRGGLRGAGGRSTDAQIAANIDRGF